MIAHVLLDIVVRLRSMEHDRSGNMNGIVADREKVNEGVVFLQTLKEGPPAQPFIEDLPSRTRGLAECHVAADAQSTKGCNLKP